MLSCCCYGTSTKWEMIKKKNNNLFFSPLVHAIVVECKKIYKNATIDLLSIVANKCSACSTLSRCRRAQGGDGAHTKSSVTLIGEILPEMRSSLLSGSDVHNPRRPRCSGLSGGWRGPQQQWQPTKTLPSLYRLWWSARHSLIQHDDDNEKRYC